MMKKLLAVSALGLFGATAAQADTETLQINGKVDYQCAITLGGQVSGTVTIGNNTGQHGVGSLNIRCNDGQGFTLSLATQNNFKLVGGGSEVPYSFNINDNASVSKTFSATNSGPVVVNGFQPAYAVAGGKEANLGFNPNTTQPIAGGETLSDTLTFTLQGNP